MTRNRREDSEKRLEEQMISELYRARTYVHKQHIRTRTCIVSLCHDDRKCRPRSYSSHAHAHIPHDV